MSPQCDNETWIVDAGHAVIAKKAVTGDAGLSLVEQLIYCLWVADYGMCNAGDLATARDLYPDFQRKAVNLAGILGLGFTHESFSLPSDVLQVQYFERFDRLCDEIKDA